MDGYIRHALGKFKKSDGYIRQCPRFEIYVISYLRNPSFMYCRSGSS